MEYLQINGIDSKISKIAFGCAIEIIVKIRMSLNGLIMCNKVNV